MWWKIYFWVTAGLTIPGVLAIYFGFQGISISSFTLSDWISSALSLAFVVGTYAYAFKKKIWSSQAWKIVFWISVVALLLTVLDVVSDGAIDKLFPFLRSSLSFSKDDVLVNMILSLPVYYAMYKLGYDASKQNKRKS